MRLISRDFLSQFWKLYSPLRKGRMQLLLKNGKQNIIVHTPGKVGSTSVYVTLKKILKNTHNVFHFHFLSEKAIDIMWKRNLESKRNSVPLHLLESKHFTQGFDYQNRSLSIIVLIREPISRYISATYQNLNMYFEEKHRADITEINTLIADGLAQNEHLTDLDWWFEKELKTKFGIDVYKDDDLIRNNGYWHFEKDKTKVYIIKMEHLNDVFTEFSEKELNLKEVQLIESNVGSNKAYSEKYRETKKTLYIPEDVIKTSKTSKFYKRFYATES